MVEGTTRFDLYNGQHTELAVIRKIYLNCVRLENLLFKAILIRFIRRKPVSTIGSEEVNPPDTT